MEKKSTTSKQEEGNEIDAEERKNLAIIRHISDDVGTVDQADTNNEDPNTSKLRKIFNNSNQRQHPVFERKIKVSGNDDFLKQIFS